MATINRDYLVRDSFPEPHSPWQNPVEARSIRWLKGTSQVLMDRQGAPDIVWLQAMEYMADIHNHTADESLGWMTPIQKRKGHTPDISAFLHFTFYEKVYYMDSDSTYPSTKEKTGYWIGVSKNIGDALTYKILTDDKETVLSRSVVRTASDRLKANLHENLRVSFNHNLDPAIRLDEDNHNKIIPLETSLNRTKVKNKHKRRYNIKTKETVTDAAQEQQSKHISHARPEVTNGQAGENVKTMTPGKHLSNPTSRTRKHKTVLRMPHAPANKVGTAPGGYVMDVEVATLGEGTNTNMTPSLLPRQKNSWSLDIEEEPPPLLDCDDNSTASGDDANRLTIGEENVKSTTTGEDASRLATGENAVTPVHQTGEDIVIPEPGENIAMPEPEPAENPNYILEEIGEENNIDAAPAPFYGDTHNDGPTVVSDEEYEDDDDRHSETKPLAKRRSSRIPKKRTILTMLVTALSIMGGETTFIENSPGLTSLNAKLRMPEVKSLEQDFSFNTILQPREARKLHELQLLDAATEALEVSEWDILEVKGHRVSSSERRIPKEGYTREKHIRFLCKFRNGQENWAQADAVRLQDPIPAIQYIKREGLAAKTNFQWAQSFLNDGNRLARMVNAFKAKVDRGPKIKFGIEVPRSPRHAMELDTMNGTNVWKESMGKELGQINEYETFRVLEADEFLPDTYKKIPYHMVFDVKFDLRRKARLVAGGNWTDPPKEDIYSGVVSLDTIQLGFSLASLNGLTVCAADVSNAFLYGRTKEQTFVIAGPKFGPEVEGKRLVINKGLYGLRSSAARFHEHLASKLRAIGFKPSRVDNDFWIRKKEDHYEYLATYVDDILAFSRDPMGIIEVIQKSYSLKGVGTPEYYLGGNIDDVSDKQWVSDGVLVALSARTYIANVMEKLETLCGVEQFAKANCPMSDLYHPELDESPLLDDMHASKYRALIGSANWVITLGRFDIAYATMALARHSMAPREGHFKAMQRVFGYLRKHQKGRILIDPGQFDHSDYQAEEYENWREFYPDADEEMPPDQPEPLGSKARITIYVDADHAHDMLTRRSVTGIILFINKTPVKWISKRQKTVETSTYGSELVASRIATDLAIEYRYALRMLGVNVDGPAMMFGDNKSVIINTTMPSSQLKKKHNAVAYHRVREAIAAQIISFFHVPSASNFADILTKPLSSSSFYKLVKPLLFRAPKWM